jgi:hypothetical protein
MTRQPTITLQWSTYAPWLILPYCLHSLSTCERFRPPNNRNFTKKLPSCKTPHIRCTPTPCTSIHQGHQQWWPRFATYQHHPWTPTSSWHAPQLPLFCLPNGYTTNNWATQQCSPTNESCHRLSSELCDSQYSSTKPNYIPIPTNTYKYSIDFLPNHEY